jgi:serine/threonine protein phosphatase PrpC
MNLRYAALTDVGKVRTQNQDHSLCQPALGLFGVADGVGGLPGGAEAAECAVRTVVHAVENTGGTAEPEAALLAASEAVGRLGELISPGVGIGTTMTFGIFQHGRARIAHVGDSRAYLLRDGKLTQLTYDHTVEMEAKRRDTPAEFLLLHPNSRNTLTRCVGQPVALQVETYERELAAGDRFLFATDGITRLMEEAELGRLLGQDVSPEEVLRSLVAEAMEGGGHDNATAVAVFVDSPAD